MAPIGLSDDLIYYGKLVRDEVKKKIGHFYPPVILPKEFGSAKATAIAWIWSRTVKCHNPACNAQVPLTRSFLLSDKKGKRTWVEPIIKGTNYHFEIRSGSGKPREGTMNRRGATCLCCSSLCL